MAAQPSAFEVAADALRTLLGDDHGPWGVGGHRWGLKLWFGEEGRAGREHYEAQAVGKRHVPQASSFAIEVGFHAEHPDDADNDAVLARLAAREQRWRRSLGGPVEAGPFLGRQGWRRVSELWIDPDLRDPDLPLAIACRLVDYADALEPTRREWTTRAGVAGRPDVAGG